MDSSSDRWLDATGQRWKLRAANALIVVMLGSFALWVIVEDRELVFRLFIAQGVSAVVALILVASIRCHVCGDLVGCWAIKRWNTHRALDQLRACPDCGARTNDDKLV